MRHIIAGPIFAIFGREDGIQFDMLRFWVNLQIDDDDKIISRTKR